MRILLINAVYGNKSTGTIVKDISELLVRQGDSPSVICLDSCINAPNVIVARSRLSNIIHALLTRLFGLQGCWSRHATKRLIKQIETINPEIVHLHNLHSNFINLPLLLDFCSVNNKPVIITLHDCWYFTGKCYHFEDVGCEKWKVGCGKCPKQNMDIPSILCDMSRKTFKIKKDVFGSVRELYVVGCSKWITEKAKLSPILSNAQFCTILNGVDTKIFSPIQSSINRQNHFTVMVMANKWFLPENEKLRQELNSWLSPKFRLKVIGCSSEQLSKCKNSDYLQYFGYTNNRNELAEHYRTADVFLNVTFIDTLPTVNMEAICCGTPVITYRSGGSPELVTEGITGYVVDQNDISGVKNALQKIKDGLIDRSECARIGKENFDKTVNYQKYINLYNQILS